MHLLVVMVLLPQPKRWLNDWKCEVRSTSLDGPMVVGIAFMEPFLHFCPVCVRYSCVDNDRRIDYDDYHDGVEEVSLS